MTLGEGEKKALKLLDEYSSGGEIQTDEDIGHRMKDLFDIAQKDVAQAKKIYRVAAIPLTGGTGTQLYDLPRDMMELVSMRRDGRVTTKYDIIGGKLVAAGNDVGELLIEYTAMPATIPDGAGDDYVFEVAEDAAECLPYYVAAQILMADLMIEFSPYWQIYLQKKAQLVPTVRRSGGGGVRNTLFRG